MRLLLVLLLVVGYAVFSRVSACIAMSPGSTPASMLCITCLATQVQTSEDDDGLYDIMTELTQSNNMCSTLLVTCELRDDAAGTVRLTFNGNAGNDAVTMPTPIRITLTCTAAGTWQRVEGGPAITSAHCGAPPPAPA